MGAALPRRKADPQLCLDYSFLQKVFLFVGVFSLVFCPLTRDPIAFAVGGIVSVDADLGSSSVPTCRWPSSSS